MTDSDRLNRRKVLTSISAVSSLGLAGCSGGNGNGNSGASTGPDGSNSGSQNLGEYGLPHCDTGEYVFHIMEIEEENSVRYANFTAKNLTTDDVKLFAVQTNGDEYIVDTRFQPQETKTIPIKGGFHPGDEFSLTVRDHDGGYDGMKCSTGSPSEEHLSRRRESNGNDRDMEDRRAAAIEDEANNRTRDVDSGSTSPVVYEFSNIAIDGDSRSTIVGIDYDRISGSGDVNANITAELRTESGETHTGSKNGALYTGGRLKMHMAYSNIQNISQIRILINEEEVFVDEPQGASNYESSTSFEVCFRNCDA